jgi:hypothetical protein
METDVMFLDCPAYLDKHGAARCGLPSEVEYRYTARSTEGLLESAKIRCPRGHWFNGTIDSLTWDKHKGSTIAQAEGARSRDAASWLTKKTRAN